MKNLYSLLFWLLFVTPSLLYGQWTTQKIPLKPGWNSVYLEVEPLPKDCGTIFSGLPIESVWAFAKQFEMEHPDSEWLIYHPNDPLLTDLYNLQGGKSYLIHLGGDEEQVLNLKGKPILPAIRWQADTLNLAGFHIDPVNPPSFKRFFAAAPELQDNDVFKMDTNGDWAPVEDLENERIGSGESYWVKCDQYSTFTAPMELVLEQENCLIFGNDLQNQMMKIRNHTSLDKQVNITKIASENNAAAAYERAGEVALTYWDDLNEQWMDLGSGISVSVPAEGEAVVHLGVDRTRMRGSEGLFQSLLEVKDGEGTRLLVAVSSGGLSDRVGLWIGSAVLDKVSYVNAADDTKPHPTASEFNLRLIVYVDERGKAHLLDEVIQMWKDGTYKPDPNDPSLKVVDQPGQYVLITDPELLDQYTGAAIRDGRFTGRRVSSAYFNFDEPQAMAGDFDDRLSLENLALPYDDPHNPFMHKYHPDHNNLDERQENKLPEGRESYTITRSIKMTFTEEDPENLSLPGWGDNQVGGVYEETIRGLHRQALTVAGTFRLRNVSKISRINEAPPLPPDPTGPDEEPEDDTPNFPEVGIQPVLDDQQEVVFFEDVIISPNPVLDRFRIIGIDDLNSQVDLTIRDWAGRRIISETYRGDESINVSDLPAGIYTLQLRRDSHFKSLKFVKQSL